MSEVSGFKPKGEIRRANSDQSQTGGFKSKGEARNFSSEQQKVIREIEQTSIQATIFQEAQALPQGTTMPLSDVRPHVQLSSDTCLLASVMAIKEAMGRRSHRVRLFDENTIAAKARRAGLLGSGGMATEREAVREQTENFLEEECGVKMDFVDTSDPVALGKICVQSLQDRRVPIINSSLGGDIGHWVSIYGMEKQGDRDINWKIADPLRPEPYTITTPQLAERLQGRGASSQMFTVDVAEMRATAYRPGTPSQ